MSMINKNPRVLSTQHNANRAALQPLRIKSATRPGSAKQWFEACNERKNEEAWRLEEWKSAVTEFQKREIQTKFYNSLIDSKNRNTWDTDIKESEAKENDLLSRRSRLKRLLQEDEERCERERQMRFYKRPESSCDSATVCPEVELLKKRLDDLKKKNEQEKRKISEKLSYEAWKNNQAQIRQLESKRLNDFVREAWIDQSQWKEDQRRKMEQEQRNAEKEAENQGRIKEAEEAQLEIERKDRHAKWKTEINKQLQMIREKEEKESILKRQEDALQREKIKIDELILKRESIIEARKRRELELFWARQHQLKLKKKSVIIQDELIQDQLLIEDFLKDISASTLIEDFQKKKEEAQWMRNVLEEQKRLEKLREKEYELIFSEEAKCMWDRRQAEWDKEQNARDGLMKEVLIGLKKQIDEKIASIANSIEKCKEERLFTISDMKHTQNNLEQEERQNSNEKLYKHPPDSVQQTAFNGINSTRAGKYEHLMQEKSVADHRKEIAQLEEEMKELWQSSYVPPRHGRKKVAW